MPVIEILAGAGTLMTVLRGGPQAWRSWKQGHSEGLSSITLWLWALGSLLLIPYCIVKAPIMLPIYITNVAFVSVMIWFKYFNRCEGEDKEGLD